MGTKVTNEPSALDRASLEAAVAATGLAEWFEGANAYLRLSSCMQPIDKVGSRVSIEGSYHLRADQDRPDAAEVIDLAVKVRARSGMPIGTYRITPGIGEQLGLELGAYFLRSESHRQLVAAKEHLDSPRAEKSAEEMLGDLLAIVSKHVDVSWQAEAAIELPSGNPKERFDQCDDGDWEKLRESRAPLIDSVIGAASAYFRLRESQMVPVLPSFSELAKAPGLALDRQWRSVRESDGIMTTVTASLRPGEVNSIDFDFTKHDKLGLLVHQDSFSAAFGGTGETGATLEQRQLALERITAEAMYKFRESGLDGLRKRVAALQSKSPRPQSSGHASWARKGTQSRQEQDPNPLDPSDQKILDGRHRAGHTIFQRRMSSGAVLRVGVGSDTAILSICPNENEPAGWIAWTVTDSTGIDREGSLIRAELLQYAEMLTAGTLEQRVAALDNLRSLSARRGGRPHGGSGSVDKLLGFGFDADLGSYGGVVVSASAPAFDNDEQVLELLSGIQHLQVTKFRSSSHPAELVNFDRALFGIYPDGSLSIRTWNKLGGQLKAKLSAATCESLGGYQEVVRAISEILSNSAAPTKSRNAHHTRLKIQMYLSSLVDLSADVNTLVSPYEERRGLRVPPVNRPAALRAYNRSGRLADVWHAETGADRCDMRLGWLDKSDLCMASFENCGPRRLDRFELITNEEGIQRFVGIFSLSETDYSQVHSLVAEFAKPLPFFEPPGAAEPSNQKRRRMSDEVVTICRLMSELSESVPSSRREVESSQLAKFLSARSS